MLSDFRLLPLSAWPHASPRKISTTSAPPRRRPPGFRSWRTTKSKVKTEATKHRECQVRRRAPAEPMNRSLTTLFPTDTGPATTSTPQSEARSETSPRSDRAALWCRRASTRTSHPTAKSSTSSTPPTSGDSAPPATTSRHLRRSQMRSRRVSTKSTPASN